MRRIPRIIIRPPMIVFAVMLVMLDGSVISLLPFTAAIVHECGHLTVMAALGADVNEIEFTLFGMEIRTPGLSLGAAGKIAVFAAGAIANLLSAAIVYLLPTPGLEAEFFAACSLSLAALNLLPIESLDGGCILQTVLSYAAPAYAHSIMKAVSAITLSLLWLAAVYLLLICDGNLSLMLFCIYLFVTLFIR